MPREQTTFSIDWIMADTRGHTVIIPNDPSGYTTWDLDRVMKKILECGGCPKGMLGLRVVGLQIKESDA